MELTLTTPIQYVPRVGPAMATRLSKLGIFTVEDLLFHIPFRYKDYSLVSPIARLQPGETVTVKGTVQSMRNVFTKNGKKFQEATVSDETGSIHVVWFNQPYLTKVIRVGDLIGLAGSLQWFGKRMVLTSPDYEVFGLAGNEGESLHMGRLVPVYPETDGITSKWLRGRVAHVLSVCADALTEYLPDHIVKKYDLMDLKRAVSTVHYPKNTEDIEQARRRLAFDELFLVQLRSWYERRKWETTQSAHTISAPKEDIVSFISSLPFELTADQKKATDEILFDMTKPFPMNRLLEGDVGSGKTVVAAIAMYSAFRAGLTSILMAPTQILALQHHQTLERLFSPLGISVHLVTGGKKKPKESPFFLSNHSQTEFYVGTHALLSESVSFTDVGLIVIDEQQRFGVKQRQLLREKGASGKTPHLLTMTATPIPRTMALTLYGNLDLSLLATMPKGRQKVKTWVVPNQKRDSAYAWIKSQLIKDSAQAFIVCPLIEESESLTTVKAATKEYERLRTDVFSTLRLGLLHGRLKPAAKTKLLEDFRKRAIDILVTTPVVEVGIDIPNATIMMIEAADRFGLAQLHQLRGRVGRSTLASYCLLFSELTDEKPLARLKALETTHNGPELAEIDLSIRGPGEMFGTRQHGVPLLKVASLTDRPLIGETQAAVREITASDPTLTVSALLREKLEKSTIETVSQD